MSRTACAPVILLLAAMAAAPVVGFSDDDAGEAPALMAMGDFNHDGIADIAVVNLPSGEGGENSGPRMLKVLLGRGDGTFRQAGAALVLGRDPRSIVVGDFNGDGNADVIVGDGDGTLIELLGDGRGNLTPAGEIAHLGSVVSIVAGDFNHDGILDLAVSDVRAGSVTILVGSGNGAFRRGWSFSLARQGTVYRLATADFNGDGIPDLAVTNEDMETYEVMLGNGNGTFTYSPGLSKVIDPNEHCAT